MPPQSPSLPPPALLLLLRHSHAFVPERPGGDARTPGQTEDDASFLFFSEIFLSAALLEITERKKNGNRIWAQRTRRDPGCG